MLYQVPASTIPVPNNADVTVNAQGFPAVSVDEGGKGVDIAVDGNVMVTSQSVAGITRVLVDINGKMTQPVINGQPMGNNLCPTGDNCRNIDRQNADMQPYTYSDFTGYGLRNYTRPKGSYQYVEKGCVDDNGMSTGQQTVWLSVVWDANVPLNTALTMTARSGNTPMPDQTWGAWTTPIAMSPADLVNVANLMPNSGDNNNYIQVEFDFTSMAKNMSPQLKSFHILHECKGGLM